MIFCAPLINSSFQKCLQRVANARINRIFGRNIDIDSETMISDVKRLQSLYRFEWPITKVNLMDTFQNARNKLCSTPGYQSSAVENLDWEWNLMVLFYNYFPLLVDMNYTGKSFTKAMLESSRDMIICGDVLEDQGRLKMIVNSNVVLQDASSKYKEGLEKFVRMKKLTVELASIKQEQNKIEMEEKRLTREIEEIARKKSVLTEAWRHLKTVMKRDLKAERKICKEIIRSYKDKKQQDERTDDLLEEFKNNVEKCIEATNKGKNVLHKWILFEQRMVDFSNVGNYLESERMTRSKRKMSSDGPSPKKLKIIAESASSADEDDDHLISPRNGMKV